LFALAHKTSLLALVVCAACTGDIGEQSTAANEMRGAGGRDIAEYWPTIEVAGGQNTRMMSYDMIKAEVTRATGKGWVVSGVDQWPRNRGALGGADYVTTFADDLTPSQQRMVLVRKMGFAVCGDLVTSEAGQATRIVFTDVDPGATLDPAAATTKAQISALFRRFFMADAADEDVSEGVALLTSLQQGGADAKAAWRGLCVSYLSSMRFLTY
jgi:hypothetical protein